MSREVPQPPRPPVRVLLTAAEAYPALERAFLGAKREIWASFRIFDPTTALRSAEGRTIGGTWFELIADTLKRGVSIRLVISDFDPVAWCEGHSGTWRSVRILIAAAEIAGPAARLKVIPAMHPARSGILPRLVFWPLIVQKLRATARRLNDMPDSKRTAALREMPGVWNWIRRARNGRLRPRYLSLPPLCPATHHQKLAVIDRRTAYIGGLDLKDRFFDSPRHDRRSDQTWHDVQLLIEGPFAAEAQAHLETFLDVTSGKVEPIAQRRLLRTLSRPRRRWLTGIGPETVAQEVFAAHQMLTRRAKRLIYVETQYFRDRKLARFLADTARQNPRLEMILILPGAPDDVAFDGNESLDARFGEFLQAQALRILRDGFGPRLFTGGAAQARPAGSGKGNGRDRLNGAPIIYTHAKVSIFDQSAAIVSSANLNGRSLRWDTEAGVWLSSPEDVRTLRQRVMAHWLPRGAGAEYFDGETARAAWEALANVNARRIPEKRQGFLLPYDLGAAERFGSAVPMLPDEVV
ncbi:MAG: phospholipase D family protein [Paracoccaceae bacterium]